MSGLDAYWRGYDATLARVRAERPRDLGALCAILNAFQPPSSGVAFFANGGDDELGSALSDAGWELAYRASYLWDAKAPGGEWIHYVEGDVYGGRNTLLP